VEPEGSDERPKMLGGGYNARMEDRSHPSLATGATSPERLNVCEDGRRTPEGVLEPEGSGWSPKDPVSVRRRSVSIRRCSVGCLTHWWRTEVRRALVAEQRAPEGSRVIKLPMNTRRCSLEAIQFRRHTGDA